MTSDLIRSIDRSRWPLRLAYLAILLLATLANLSPALDPAAAAARTEGMVPSHLTGKDLIDVARNVVLFAGWGLIWMATSPRGQARRSMGLAVGTGLAISIAVETAQLFSATRSPSLLDVLANAGGAFLGAVTIVVTVRFLAKLRTEKSFVGLPAAVFAGGYGLAVLGESLIPLFRQQRLRVGGDPLNRLAYALREFDPSSFAVLPLSELVLFAPAGFFLTAALVEGGRSYGRAAGLAALAGSLLVTLAEAARGGVSLAILGGPIVVHVSAIVLGAVAAAVLLPRAASSLRGPERPQLLYAIYAGVVALWFLRPYVPEMRPSAWLEELGGRWWMPLGFAADRLDLFSVIDVTTVFFLYLPLGGLLAVWPFRRAGPWRGIVPGVILVVALEAAQVFVLGRTLSMADMLIGSAAVWTGWLIVRRAGFPVRGEVAGTRTT